ncbi:MAG TPA: sigma-70 family RNA polymerase sigma factor [Candidatus Hydrogenedentes bacterium]|mgnify:CR=1 FL=1|nr:sigma-70 family RNA polymerase sigma factor [Candidatus Hydrogenedentota bacterium]HPG66694.1 sigma-70 family RNA polymerase sigma factor [Candidatus Hydrogenedentota bacterium]
MESVDARLTKRWQRRGDAEAFRVLVERHGPMVYGVCCRILRSAAEAEDVVQECFEKLARQTQPLSGSTGAWLHRMATNKAIDHLRIQGRRLAREKRFAAAQQSGESQAPDDLYEYVAEAIGKLPEEHRSVVIAHFLENQTHEAIAKDLGLSRRTVSRRSAEAVELIRVSLRERGITVAAAALAAFMGKSASGATLPPTLAARLGKLALAGKGTGIGAPVTIGRALGLKFVLPLVVAAVAVAGLFGVTSFRTTSGPSDSAVARSTSLQPAEVHPDLSEDGPAPEQKAGAASGASAQGKSVGDSAKPAASAREPGSVSGTMTFTGRPAAGMEVQLHPETGERVDTNTDSAGVYRFVDVPPGEHRLVAWLSEAEEFDNPVLIRKLPITVRAGEETTVDFAFPKPGRLVEGVVTLDGERVGDTGIAKATLEVLGYSGTTLYKAGANIGRNGRFGFEDVPEGHATLRAWVKVKRIGRDAELQQVERFTIAGGDEVFREVELAAQGDSLVVGLQGPVERYKGSVTVLKGRVELPAPSKKALEALGNVRVAARNFHEHEALHFGELDPGTYTVVLLAIERQYLNLPESEQLARAQIGTEVVHVERSTTNTVEFALP